MALMALPSSTMALMALPSSTMALMALTSSTMALMALTSSTMALMALTSSTKWPRRPRICGVTPPLAPAGRQGATPRRRRTTPRPCRRRCGGCSSRRATAGRR